MTLYDAHIHYGDGAQARDIAAASPLREKFICYKTFQHWNMGDYPALLTGRGVGKAAVIPFVFAEQDKNVENLRVIGFSKTMPGLCPFAVLDEENVGFVTEHKDELYGVKEHIVLHESALSPRKKEIFARVSEYGMTLILHSWGDKRVGYVNSILENFPGMKIQIAHMGRDGSGSLEFIYHILESFAPYENVFFDTSTIRKPEAIERAVDIVGGGRILYGSDFPFFKDENEDIMSEQINHVLSANIPESVKERIFYKNFDVYHNK